MKRSGASAGIRTRDPHLTKVVRYHAMPLRLRATDGAEGGLSAKPIGLRFEPAIFLQSPASDDLQMSQAPVIILF